MRIQLKQFEIEAALKGYLANQGIAVQGKAVTMDFTAGRKNKGISVEVVVEDQVHTVAADPVYTSSDTFAAQTEAPDAVVSAAEATDEPPVDEVKPATTSLFG